MIKITKKVSNAIVFYGSMSSLLVSPSIRINFDGSCFRRSKKFLIRSTVLRHIKCNPVIDVKKKTGNENSYFSWGFKKKELPNL